VVVVEPAVVVMMAVHQVMVDQETKVVPAESRDQI
jgi:hypothetical protein